MTLTFDQRTHLTAARYGHLFENASGRPVIQPTNTTGNVLRVNAKISVAASIRGVYRRRPHRPPFRPTSRSDMQHLTETLTEGPKLSPSRWVERSAGRALELGAVPCTATACAEEVKP